MEHLIPLQGYPSLFLLSFLASTLIPLGSEWMLAAMLMARHDPVATVAVASVGNYLGACTTWLIGIHGGPFLTRRVLGIDRDKEERAMALFGRYGSWSLLFSWLPLIGDPLCLAAGIMGVGFGRFSLLVTTGKVCRYSAVAWLTLEGMGALQG